MTMRTISHVLVTGGAGFIGSNWVHRMLQTQDVHITVLDAMTYAANPANLATEEGKPLTVAYPGRFRFVKGDIRDKDVVQGLVRDLSESAKRQGSTPIILNFAAESHNDNSMSNPEIFYQTNVMGTLTLVQAAVQYGVHVHHVSTDEVFGDLPLEGDDSFSLQSPYRPSSSYSASKASSDHVVRSFVRTHGLKATISNCSNNYGPRQHPEKFIARQITALLRGKPARLYGTGENIRDWIHVDDHNDAIWTILKEGEEGGTYLIGAKNQRSNRSVVETLLVLMDKEPGDYVQVTDRPGHDRRYAIDPSSMEELGWEPQYKDFSSGLAHTIEWYKNNSSWWEESRNKSELTYLKTEKIIESS